VEKGLSKKYKTIAIHPGMSGSALNWPEQHYIALGRQLVRRYNILITGGPGEEALVDRVYQGISKNQSHVPDQPMFSKFLGVKGLEEMIAIIDQCDGLVAASTGPMHLAVALGKKVITVFSPIRVQSAVRWGPYGVSCGSNLGVSPDNQCSILVPDVNCAEDFKCALAACIYYPCMPRISVEDAEAQVLSLLEGGAITMFKSTTFSGYDIDDAFEENE
jgi:ADP-heptose:LPS heptosyltransferase